ncbi:unnamed protein product [Eruca vesicaria subsp. sativa]|uniref:P-type ATPase C-terminal domain-containing protein n=1 Tax=Eruca vesicaria subsp. sativa TaxID=29727 RepID=A0ABC8LPQ3_ERUVS|nr:unnamed protein product [Eruca vesicaria subsp. sativa]
MELYVQTGTKDKDINLVLGLSIRAITVKAGGVAPPVTEVLLGGSILAWLVFAFIYCGITTPRDRNENVYFVIHVMMSTFYFYFTLLLVPVVSLLCDFIFQGVERWFFPYDYQIVQEIHGHESDASKADHLEIENELTPQEARSYAISQLPREL